MTVLGPAYSRSFDNGRGYVMTEPNALCSAGSPALDGFEVTQRWRDGVAVVAVRGDLDMLTAPQVMDVLAEVLTNSPGALIVDLSEVAFLASSGMTTLMAGHEQAGPTIWFGVVAEGPTTSRPMKLLGLDQMLNLYATLEDASVVARQHVLTPHD
jgi:anti-anti-sigma factor